VAADIATITASVAIAAIATAVTVAARRSHHRRVGVQRGSVAGARAASSADAMRERAEALFSSTMTRTMRGLGRAPSRATVRAPAWAVARRWRRGALHRGSRRAASGAMPRDAARLAGGAALTVAWAGARRSARCAASGGRRLGWRRGRRRVGRAVSRVRASGRACGVAAPSAMRCGALSGRRQPNGGVGGWAAGGVTQGLGWAPARAAVRVAARRWCHVTGTRRRAEWRVRCRGAMRRTVRRAWRAVRR